MWSAVDTPAAISISGAETARAGLKNVRESI